MVPTVGELHYKVIMNPSKNWLKHKDLTVSGE